jgi:hypothetical protein
MDCRYEGSAVDLGGRRRDNYWNSEHAGCARQGDGVIEQDLSVNRLYAKSKTGLVINQEKRAFVRL